MNKENLTYISVGDHIVKPWYQENIRLGNIPPENEKHSYYMSRDCSKSFTRSLVD